MGNLDRRRQMADVNDLESPLLKVCNSFVVEVVVKCPWAAWSRWK
jgi:hypothetical protein